MGRSLKPVTGSTSSLSGGGTEWRAVHLGDIVEFRREPIDPQANSGLPYVGLEHMDPGQVTLSRWGAGAEVRSLKSRFYPGDILYGKLRPYLDKAALATIEGLCSTDIIVLKCSEQTIPEFVVEVLHTQNFLAFADATTTGLNHPRTSWNSIKDFALQLPPLPEQRSIARVLSMINRAKQATREVIGAAMETRRSMMAHFFSNAAWPRVKLGSAVQLIMGQSPPSEFYNETGEGLPFLQGKAEFSEKYPRPSKYCAQTLKLAPSGSVLLSVRAPVGDVNLADQDYVIGRGVAALRLKEGNNEFLFYLLTHQKPQVEALGSGTTFDSVNKGSLEQLEISIPALQEQEKIAGMFSSVDKKIASEQARLAELGGLYQALLHELMTGKIRLAVQEVEAHA